jgi:transcriptional regulator GlxA family with amidase domain
MHERGALICSACGGSLVLAAAGLLSGREATTHWSHVPVFRQEFPDVFLYQWHRDGQLPYASMAVNVVHADAVVLKCQTWLAENYDRADVVTEVARVSGLPKRTFDRRFRVATGYSPLAYVQALRIEEAKQMLETGSEPVDAIGREVGYGDASSFSRLFRRLTGISPGDYRRRFKIPDYARSSSQDARAGGRVTKGSAAG